MTIIRTAPATYNDRGDATKARAICAAAQAEWDAIKATAKGPKANGWECRFRNRLMREAGVGYSVALNLIGAIRCAHPTYAKAAEAYWSEGA